MKKNTGNMSFAELALSKRKINTRFFGTVNAMIDWGRIERVIDQFDTRGSAGWQSLLRWPRAFQNEFAWNLVWAE